MFATPFKHLLAFDSVLVILFSISSAFASRYIFLDCYIFYTNPEIELFGEMFDIVATFYSIHTMICSFCKCSVGRSLNDFSYLFMLHTNFKQFAKLLSIFFFLEGTHLFNPLINKNVLFKIIQKQIHFIHIVNKSAEKSNRTIWKWKSIVVWKPECSYVLISLCVNFKKNLTR